jgi:uncharacterized protein (TIGR02594 family)
MIPARFTWLNTIGELPRLVSTGLQYLGLKEITGVNSNPVIMNMAKQLNVNKIYTNDDMSWCALFISFICKIADKPMPYKEWAILRAASFKTWGNEVEKGKEALGDILVFSRPGGHHVAIYIAETPTTFLVLGGNQSNAVSFTEIRKTRLLTARRFYKTGMPDSAKKYFVSSTGLVSSNES